MAQEEHGDTGTGGGRGGEGRGDNGRGAHGSVFIVHGS